MVINYTNIIKNMFPDVQINATITMYNLNVLLKYRCWF